MEYKVAHFDLDGTLWDPHEFIDFTLPHCVRRGIEKGLKGKQEDILKELYGIREEQGSNYDWHFNLLVQRVNGEDDPRIVRAMVNQYHKSKASNMQTYPNIDNVLKHCTREGYILTVPTNGVMDKQEAKLNDLHLMPYFEVEEIEPEIRVKDEMLAVGEGDYSKPTPHTWLELRDKVNRYFGEIGMEVHVGDKSKADVYGANSLGIVSVKLDAGKHNGENIEKIIEEDGRDPQALRRLLEPDYRISDMREFPATLHNIENNYVNLMPKKREQMEVAADITY